jgi:hypothetical protein
MLHVKNNSFPTTPNINSYAELCDFVESYKRSPLYEMREQNSLIFEIETNKILTSYPPQYTLYYKYQSEPMYKQLNLTFDKICNFLTNYCVDTNDKLLLEQFVGKTLNVRQQHIKVFC